MTEPSRSPFETSPRRGIRLGRRVKAFGRYFIQAFSFQSRHYISRGLYVRLTAVLFAVETALILGVFIAFTAGSEVARTNVGSLSWMGILLVILVVVLVPWIAIRQVSLVASRLRAAGTSFTEWNAQYGRLWLVAGLPIALTAIKALFLKDASEQQASTKTTSETSQRALGPTSNRPARQSSSGAQRDPISLLRPDPNTKRDLRSSAFSFDSHSVPKSRTHLNSLGRQVVRAFSYRRLEYISRDQYSRLTGVLFSTFVLLGGGLILLFTIGSDVVKRDSNTLNTAGNAVMAVAAVFALWIMLRQFSLAASRFRTVEESLGRWSSRYFFVWLIPPMGVWILAMEARRFEDMSEYRANRRVLEEHPPRPSP